MKTAESLGYSICEETGCVILYLSVEQLKNITYMVSEVASCEENAMERNGEFLLNELCECLEGASGGNMEHLTFNEYPFNQPQGDWIFNRTF